MMSTPERRPLSYRLREPDIHDQYTNCDMCSILRTLLHCLVEKKKTMNKDIDGVVLLDANGDEKYFFN